MSGDRITYNHAQVADLASQVGTTAAQLMEIHDDISQLTQVLAEYFMGKGATGFFDAQQQALHGLDGLITTVSRHGQTVTSVHGHAQTTDASCATFF